MCGLTQCERLERTLTGGLFLKRTLTLVIAALALTAVAAPSAPAAIKITKIYFDSPGSDGGSNSSLNAEYVRIKNTGSTARQLRDWTVRDTANHVYRFGSLSLGGGNSVTLHTGNGSNTAAHRYWRNGWYIWNNDGDRATLKNAGGTTIDSCSYSGAGDYVNC